MLRTPQTFFDAAWRAGFGIVIGSFRENQLARDISSFELKMQHSHDKRKMGVELAGMREWEQKVSQRVHPPATTHTSRQI